MDKTELIKLGSPDFHESIGVLPKWRVGDSAGDGKNEIYPYYDADQCETILDEVCGIGGWGNEYREVAGILFCSIQIMTDGGMIEKSDAGGARASRKTSMQETDKKTFEDKTAASSAFVRAAAKWGIGRHLEILPKIQLKADSSGFNIPTGERFPIAKLSEWCNQTSPSVKHLAAIYKLNESGFMANERAMQLLSELRQFVEKGAQS